MREGGREEREGREGGRERGEGGEGGVAQKDERRVDVVDVGPVRPRRKE